MNLNTINIDIIKRVFNKKKYVFFENGDYNLNIIGIRTNDKFTNTYSDYFLLVYKFNGNWNIDVYTGSTKAGNYWVKDKMLPKGVFVLKPGQYLSTWEFVDSYTQSHGCPHLNQIKGKCLVGWRDSDKDGQIDKLNEQLLCDSINIHCASSNKNVVGNWSAGCQVIPRYGGQYGRFINTIKVSAKYYGDKFSYTLLEENDFEDLL